MDETLKALGGGTPAQSKDIVFFSTPDIAENGAVVPIGITSNVPKTESIAILVEKNPNMLAAVFDIPAGTEPSLSTRIKMGQTSNVYALVKADGKYYVASKEIKVTLGRVRRLECIDTEHDGRSDENPGERRRRFDRGEGADEPRNGDRPAQGRAGRDDSRVVHPDRDGRRTTARRCWRRSGVPPWRRTRSCRSSSRVAPRATRSGSPGSTITATSAPTRRPSPDRSVGRHPYNGTAFARSAGCGAF